MTTISRRTALYCRLSNDDGSEMESNSISNQKRILSEYAASHGFTNTHFYVDDGWSGANFDRPSVQALLEDVDKGIVSTIICKDMSRFGRDYLNVGMFTEMKFPEAGVRFIAVSEGYDSETGCVDDFAPFRNIINEWYCRDISKKMKASMQVRVMGGEHIAPTPPFGYIKSEADSKLWVIDEEAAKTVRDIFRLYISLQSFSKVANFLTENNYESPNEYYAKHNIDTKRRIADFWYPGTVKLIIDRYEYCGHTVSYRTQVPSYKHKKSIKNPRDEWIITKNTQEPIIEEHTWRIAHEIRMNMTRKMSSPNIIKKGPLYAFLRCTDCGRRMYHKKRRHEKGAYFCSGYLRMKKCSPNKTDRDMLETFVMDKIRQTCEFALMRERSFTSIVIKKKLGEEYKTSRSEDKVYDEILTRLTELDVCVRQLYEDKITGMITQEQFYNLLRDNENEQTVLRKRRDEIKQSVDKKREVENSAKLFIKAAKATDLGELTIDVADALIDYIEISPVSIEDGREKKNIRIIYKYIGDFNN